MSTPDSPVPSENRRRHWLRVLRPLVLWVVLALVLYGYRTHQRLSQETRLVFSVVLDGKGRVSEATPTLDGHPVKSGERVQIGRQTFTVSHPKYEPYATNLFLYGERHLGEIVLKRSAGVLALAVDPPSLLTVRGTEFALMLTNSSGITSSVPTDAYRVESRWKHHQMADSVVVGVGGNSPIQFAPPFGSLSVASTHSNTSFRLANKGGDVLLAGELPAVVDDLLAGAYEITTERGSERRNKPVWVNGGATNEVWIEYEYGALAVETDPPGATIVGSGGTTLGTTPLTLQELVPGTWQGEIRLPLHVPIALTLEVMPNQTNVVQTNLVTRHYARVMESARSSVASGDYDLALEMTGMALRAEPNDPDAIALQRKAGLARHIERATAFGTNGDYASAIDELESSLKISPDDTKANQLLADYEARRKEVLTEQKRAREQQLAEQERFERLNRPGRYFGEWMKDTLNSELFEQKKLVVKGSLPEVEAKLTRALMNGQPEFSLLTLEPENLPPETFRMRAKQKLGAEGWRRCDLVGGQTSDDEVTLVFKVFEYAYVEAFSIRAWIGEDDERKMLPIHPTRLVQRKAYLLERRAEGITLIRRLLRKASGD